MTPDEFLLEQRRWLPAHGRVVCLEPGDGHGAVFLAQAGHRVLVVDPSLEVLAATERLAHTRGVRVETLELDLHDYEPARKSLDAVVIIGSDLPAGIRATVHHRVEVALRPGGVALIEVDHPRHLGSEASRREHECTHTLEELEHHFTGLHTLYGFEGVVDFKDGPCFVSRYVGRRR